MAELDLSQYNFHEHLLTEKDKAELNKMYIVSFRGQETIVNTVGLRRLDLELTKRGFCLRYREATEEEVKLHNEWLEAKQSAQRSQ